MSQPSGQQAGSRSPTAAGQGTDRKTPGAPSRGFIRRAHEVGLDVHVWTLNTRAEIERALDLGADGVMTDDVVLLRDVLAERGEWHPRVVA
jgi:glycerophosphoryl diester phosphodiesterase